MRMSHKFLSGVSGVALAAAVVFIPGSPISVSDAVAGGKPPVKPNEIPVEVDRQIRLMSPHTWETMSGTHQVAASVGKHTDISGVMFAAATYDENGNFVSSVLIGADYDGSDGWSVPWDTTAAPNGTCGVSAIALVSGGGIRYGRGIFAEVAN